MIYREYETRFDDYEGKTEYMTVLIKREDAIKEIECAMETSESIILIAGLACAKGIIASLPSADAEQVTSKLKKPCDSLLTDDSAECKEQKSKLEHDREWIIGCIKHDGFIKTDRFDKANQIILEALSADAVSREDADMLVGLRNFKEYIRGYNNATANADIPKVIGIDYSPYKIQTTAPSANAEWIPIATEPNTSDHVLVTYKWDGDDYEVSELDYWVTKYEAEKGNEKCKWFIEHVIAWQPLPTPYKGGDDE